MLLMRMLNWLLVMLRLWCVEAAARITLLLVLLVLLVVERGVEGWSRVMVRRTNGRGKGE